MTAYSTAFTVAWTASAPPVCLRGSSDSGRVCAGQLCSAEDAGNGHLTTTSYLSSCLRTDTVRGQESATLGKHQNPGSGHGPLPAFRFLRFCCCSSSRSTSQRVSALRKVAGNLDSRGILTLYKAQIRPCIEYAALTWMSTAATYMKRLDAVQRRALRLVDTDEHQQPAHVTSL